MNEVKVIRSPEIDCREQFGELLNARGLWGQAVEIGTFMGQFAIDFLETWTGEKLWCIDPYQNNLPDYPPEDPVTQYDLEAVYHATLKAFEPYRPRVEIIRMFAEEAAGRFEDGSLDFAHVDAMHVEPVVRGQVELYWPKIRPGGIFAGHDWSDPWAPAVQPPVRELAARTGLPIYILPGVTWSWYIEKPVEKLP